MPTFPKSTGNVVTAADWNTLNVLLGETTASGASNALTVSSIPQTHRDMLVVVHGNHAAQVDSTSLRGVTLTLNGDTGSNYRWVRVETDDNSSPLRQSSLGTTSLAIGAFGDDTLLSSFRLELFSYSATGNKGLHWRSFGTTGTLSGSTRMVQGGGAWIGAAVTSVTATIAVETWATSTKMRVYGLGLV